MTNLFFRIKFLVTKAFTISSEKISTFIASPWGLTLFIVSVIIMVKLQTTFAADNVWFTIANIVQITNAVLLIINQTTQNRDTKAIMVKLDGLIIANNDADNKLINVEQKEQVEIVEIAKEIKGVVEAGKESIQN